MQKLFSILVLVVLYAGITFGQAAIDIPITVEDNAANSKVLNFGLDPTATDGIDAALGESDLPPMPFGFEARFVLPGGALSSYKDYRNAPAFPYTGTKVHVLKYQVGDGGGTEITISWDLPTGVTGNLNDQISGELINVPMSGTGNYTVTNPAGFPQLNMTINYVNVGPVEPGPVFAVSPATLNFGNVGLGGSLTETLTVSNLGSTNAMTITSASITNTDYVVTPNPPAVFPIVVPAGGSYNFDVTFTANNPGVSAGNVEFVHDAPGTPGLVPVTGNGQAQGGDLVFNPQSRTIFDNTQGYSTAIRLENYVGDDLKALQFKIVLDGLLLFRSIERGSAITTPEWNFSYQIAEGNLNADGSRNDTVKVVIVGNGNNQLPAGDYEIAVFEYDAVDIAANQLTTTVHFENVIGATGTPNPGGDANITAGAPQDITINNRVFYGDVNIDNRVDILDLLLMIDYILDRVTFTTEQFTRGDISPWTAGQPAPSPDGEINALDLALLQNIILTGVYPSSEPAQGPIKNPGIVNNELAKINPGDDAALTFYVTENGISVVVESIINVKGLQVELSNVSSSISGMAVETELGSGYYYQNEDRVRVLVYDGQGQTLEPGEYLFLNMPFRLNNPKDVKIDDIILANENNEMIEKFNIEIINGDAPQLPTEYRLSQNYPNPFNPTTTVQFTVPKASEVTIAVFDMLGQQVRTLHSGQAQRGTYTVNWDGENESGLKMSSGSYIYRMISGEFIQSKKMILMK
jgi:hypothetical protein